MPRLTLVDEDVLKNNRPADNVNVGINFLFELSYNRGFRCFAKFYATANRPHSLEVAFPIVNLKRQEPRASPM